MSSLRVERRQASALIEMPKQEANFLQIERTFTFEMFDQPSAELNV
jgi:hypothetical protein